VEELARPLVLQIGDPPEGDVEVGGDGVQHVLQLLRARREHELLDQEHVPLLQLVQRNALAKDAAQTGRGVVHGEAVPPRRACKVAEDLPEDGVHHVRAIRLLQVR